MKPLVIIMLAVDAALILVTAWTVLKVRPTAARPRPIWSSLAMSLVVTAMVTFEIADRHRGRDGGELLEYVSGLLMGMGLMSLLVLLRQRLGTDSAP